MRRSFSLHQQCLSVSMLLTALSLAAGCSSDPAPAAKPTADQQSILSVQEVENWAIPGLQDEVHVVRTESNVPHIYAKNRLDLARVHGFVVARDR